MLVRSEDQEEELLSSVFVDGLPAKAGKSKGEKVLVGGAGGVLTLWEKGKWLDQHERIVVSRGVGGGESVDTLAVLPDGMGMAGVGGRGRCVAAGMGDGTVKVARLGPNKVVDGLELRHDEVEGVVGLDVDVEGRLISGGGQIVKVWTEMEFADEDEAEEGEDGIGSRKRNGEDDSDDSEDDSTEEDVKERRKKKKRKRNKGNEREPVRPSILGFKGLD